MQHYLYFKHHYVSSNYSYPVCFTVKEKNKMVDFIKKYLEIASMDILRLHNSEFAENMKIKFTYQELFDMIDEAEEITEEELKFIKRISPSEEMGKDLLNEMVDYIAYELSKNNLQKEYDEFCAELDKLE